MNVALHSFPDDLLHEAKAFGRERHIKQAGEEENSRNMDPVPKLDYCDIFPICFLSLSLFFFYDTNMSFGCLLAPSLCIHYSLL